MVKSENKLFFEKDYQFGYVSDGGGIYHFCKDIGDGYIELQFHNCLNWGNSHSMIPIYDIVFNDVPKDQRLLSALYHELKDFCLSSGYNENWKDIVEW